MQDKQILTISENRAAIHNISESVLVEIAPDEAAISTGFLNATIATLAKGQISQLDSSDISGGLGGTDWVVLIIVPTVVTLITNFLVSGKVDSVTMLKSALSLTGPGDIEAQIRFDDVKAIIQKTGAKWNKRQVRKFIQLVSVALWEVLEEESPLAIGMGQGIPAQVYQRLYTTLLRCGPFENDNDLRPVFLDARIAPWYDKLPQAVNQEKRIRGVIDLLYQQYSVSHKNALVLLLEVLSDQVNVGNACHQELIDMAQILDSVVGNYG